jgi:hypothetical protein
LLTKARTEAIHDATERAQVYAKAAGIALGPILSVSEGGAEMPRPAYSARIAAAPMAPPPVAAGEESVSANVSITFAIR